jgi:hypothetical protein
MNSDMLIDTLINSMENYEDERDFIYDLYPNTGIDKRTLSKIFNDFWGVDPMDRFEWDFPEWSQWLRKNYNIRESNQTVITIKDEVKIPQKNKDIILEKGDKIKVLKERGYNPDTAIPQESLQRASVRDDLSRPNSSHTQAFKSYNLSFEDYVGWFANSYNMAFGWYIYLPSDFDRREFGEDVFRLYSEKTDTSNIVKFNLLAGTYAFIDSEAYEQDIVRFEKMTKYNRLFIEPKQEAFYAFNIV